MSLVSGIVSFVIIWWLVFFMMLPIGVRRNDNPEPGHDHGAPEKPALWRKALVTSLIAAVLFLIWWYMNIAGMVGFSRGGAS